MKTEPELRQQQEHDAQPEGPAPEPLMDERVQRRVAPLLLVAFVAWLGYVGGWSLIAFVVAIITMITLHELGHYLTARWSGMKVTEYFLGFGPRLWSFRKGETEYGVKLIPAG